MNLQGTSAKSSLVGDKNPESGSSSSTLHLRVIFCDVDKPEMAAPLFLTAPLSMTVKELQEELYRLAPRNAQSANSVRLFCCKGDPGSSIPPPLYFCSRPAESIADLDLYPFPPKQSARTLYWASNLMAFQSSQSSVVQQCDEEVKTMCDAVEVQRANAKKRDRDDARREFWAAPQTLWPPDLDATKTRFYWSEENEHQMGNSILLEFLPEKGEFRRHEHEWMDGGRRTSHHHTKTKGVYRLFPSQKANASSYQIRLVPTHQWASSKIPVAWDDDAAFTRVDPLKADPQVFGTLDAEGVEHAGSRLRFCKG